MKNLGPDSTAQEINDQFSLGILETLKFILENFDKSIITKESVNSAFKSWNPATLELILENFNNIIECTDSENHITALIFHADEPNNKKNEQITDSSDTNLIEPSSSSQHDHYLYGSQNDDQPKL